MATSQNEPRVYSSIIVNNYLKYLTANYPAIDIDDLLRDSRLERHEVEDPLYWMTQSQAHLFFEKLSAHFDDPLKMAREAGRQIYSEISLGLLKYLSLNILGVGVLYKKVSKVASKLTKTSVFKTRRIASNKYEIEFTLLPGFKEMPHQEWNRIGILEAGPLLFSDKLADVKSSKKDRTTIYTIEWERPRSEKLTRYFMLFLALFLLAVFLLYPSGNISILKHLFPFVTISSFCFLLLRQHIRYKELSQVHKKHIEIVNQTIDNFSSDHQDLTKLNEIGDIINKSSQLDIILQEISNLISSDYNKGIFFISDSKKDFVSVQHLYGFDSKLKHINIDLIPFINNIDIHKPALFKDIESFHANQPLKPYAEHFSAADFPLCWVPIAFDRSLIGFFILSPNKAKLPIRQRDLHFLMGISSRIASGIHRLYAFATLIENDRIKSDFITTASHELRTPVQIILLGLSNLHENPTVKKEAADDLDIVESGTLRLREIISNILDLSALESEKDYKFDLHPASEVLTSIKPEMVNLTIANNHQVLFDYDETMLLRCDVSNLPTAIINLFSNACKYTSEGGKILLKIKDLFSETVIDVIDNGYGIPAEIQDKVFIKFFQSNTCRNETLGGCGIGLSIAKEIINAHGGEISITSPLKSQEYPELGLSPERLGTRARIHLSK